MRHILPIAKLSLLVAIVSAGLSSCGSPSSDALTVVHTRGFQPNHGPFDSKGNYIESWADKPPKRRYVTAEEYANLGKKGKRNVSKPTSPPTRLKPIYPSEPQLVARHTPKAQTVSTYSTAASRPKPVSKPKPRVSSKPKKKKSVAVKPKAKPPIVHKVKKGDTLYGLSRKYKTTIGGIQRANKLNSTHIGIGDRLIIPRK